MFSFLNITRNLYNFLRKNTCQYPFILTYLTSTTFTFQTRLTFIGTDRAAAGLTLSDVIIYHDEDKSFKWISNNYDHSKFYTGVYTTTTDVFANSKFTIDDDFGNWESLQLYQIIYDNCDANKVTLITAFL